MSPVINYPVISKIRFINCQSLGIRDIDLTSGLNVIIGDNSRGKSVLFKMLKLSCGAKAFEKSDIRHLITYGADEAACIFVLSDGSAGGVQISDKCIHYLYRPTKDQGIAKYIEPHPEFLYKMSIIMDKSEDFILNIIDPDQELIFVSSKPTTNFTVLKLISSNDELEHLIYNLDVFMQDVCAMQQNAIEEDNRIQSELSNLSYIDISGIRESVEIIEPLLPLCYSLSQTYDIISQITLFPKRDNSGLLPYLDTYNIMDLICQDIRRIVPVNVKNTEQLLNILGIVLVLESISSDLSNVRNIRAINFSNMEQILGINSLITDFHHLLQEYLSNTNVLAVKNHSLENYYSELSELVQIVDCPIKGRVYYFEDKNCLEVGSSD